MNKIKNVLVTGGAGYIGSHAVYELIRANYNVIVLDNLSTGNKAAIHKDVKFYKGDQMDSDLLNKIFKENKIDAVMHFSAKLVVPESVEEPIMYFENNIHGLAVLLQAMKDNNVKNIVFSSTAAVYGDPQKEILSEGDATEPINPYGQSKLACEWLIKSSAKAYGLNYTIFRYFNVAGADHSGEIGLSTKGRQLTHLIPVVIETALGQRESMSVFGDKFKTFDGSGVRDYIHVTDLAKAHIGGLKHMENNKSGIFNLGSESGHSVFGVIREVESLGYKVNHKIEKARAGDPAILIASNSKAKKDISFETTHDLKSIIESDIAWRKNKKY